MLPSQIENTLAGKQFTGNHYADRLANEGRQKPGDGGEKDRISYVREQILTATLQLINKLDNRLELLDNPPDGPSAHADDFGALANADRGPRQGPRDT